MRIDPIADRQMITRVQSGRSRGPWIRLLGEVLQLAGTKSELIRHTEKPWSSATFSGARHYICLSFKGDTAMDDADDFIAALPDHEFTIPSQIVADASTISVDQQTLPEQKVTIETELLLLDDE